MTFAEIQTKADALGHVYGTLGHSLMHVLGNAADNAADTIYVEHARPEEDYDALALASLEQVLGYCNDSDVTDWFKSIGFRW